jgi:TP901 family phage tail tape measure protein
MAFGLENLGLGITLDLSDKMSGKIGTADRRLKTLGTTSDRTGRKVVSNTDRMTAALSRYARGFTVGFKLMALGAAVEAPLFLMAKGAAQTEHAFSEVRSLMVDTGLTIEQIDARMKSLKDTVRRVASESILPFKQSLLGVYPLASKFGVDVAEALFEPVSRLAMVGKGQVLDAVRVMNQLFDTMLADREYEDWTDMEKGNKIVETLSSTIKLYDTDLIRLAEAMKYAVPQAKTLGLSFDETASMVGALTGVMVTGSKAGTSYSAFLRGITQFTKRLGDATSGTASSLSGMIKVLEGGSMGAGGGKLIKNPLAQIQWTDPSGAIKSVSEILREIGELFGISNEDDIKLLSENQAMLEAFSDEGSRAVSILMEMTDEIDAKTEAIKRGNTSQNMLNVITADSYSRAMKFKNAIIILGDAIGDVILKDVDVFVERLDAVRKTMLDWVLENEKAVGWLSRMVMVLGAVGILAGGITIMTFGVKTAIEAFAIIIKQIAWVASLFIWLGNTVAGLYVQLALLAVWEKIVAAATWLLNTALLANPITWVVLGVIALIAAIVVLIKYWDQIYSTVVNFFTTLRSKLRQAPDWLLALCGPILLLIKYWDEFWWSMNFVLKKIWSAISWVFSRIHGLVQDVPDWLLLTMGPLLLIIKHWDDIVDIVKDLVFWLSLVYSWVSDYIGNELRIWGTIWTVMLDDAKLYFSELETLWGTFKIFLASIWGDIKDSIMLEIDFLMGTPVMKGFMKMMELAGGLGIWALHNLGFGETFTGIPNELPGPERAAIASSAVTDVLTGNISTDYSVHRSNINIYPNQTQSPTDIASEVDLVLSPSGEM